MLKQIFDSWNNVFGDTLFVRKELIEATFVESVEVKTRVVETANHWFFLKTSKEIVRIHWVVPKKGPLSENNLRPEIEEIGSKTGNIKLVFGGGMNHIFPGIPIHNTFKSWLKVFKANGASVMDFEGELRKIASPLEKQSQIELRQCRNELEEKLLESFVEKEFPGRWHNELMVDLKRQMLEHYLGVWGQGVLLAYVRLYGWRKDYWAPGVYFSGPGNETGGLGPIGVSALQRGRGLGSQIVAEGLRILFEKGLQKIRIDWTTERAFYERAGLNVIQEYQPAVFNFS